MAAVPETPPAIQAAGGKSPTAGRAAPTAPPTGLAAGTLAGTASGLAAGVTVAAVPGIPIATTQAAVMAAYLEYLRHIRFYDEDWVRRTMAAAPAKTGVAIPQQAVMDTIADENARQVEFNRRAEERMRRDLPKAFVLTDPKARDAALRKLLDRERGYARARSEAMAVRAFSTVDRVVLRQESPTGAFWKLDPTVTRHTKDCIAMGGKFWPWVVLDDFHPPTHAHCRCSLHGYAKAIAAGWMRPGDVMDVATAIRRAAAAKALLHEEELDQWEEIAAAVLRTGLASPAEYTAAMRKVLGR